MGRIRTAGLVKRGEVWHIDKTIGGKRLCESTGETELDQACSRQEDEDYQPRFG